ncbi:divergent polysaccharide deacetylase family protein [Oceanibaculum sp.]|uniref:divergent polysaccharide deacetylase family protein n=1 Tax=Oceanibaculum sp. TaxID=1903597 RepID=UPI00258A3544|nr:divergent polysaccharide deacetylase family protein [Oceanibaculum sp.]MCH2394873.1 divergent polysaccharide deacetylase family protein [Oceanibaculum sp.]
MAEKRGLGAALTGRLGQLLVLMLLIGGVGALGAWLAAKGPDTAAERALRMPRATLSFIPPEQRQPRPAPPAATAPTETPAPAQQTAEAPAAATPPAQPAPAETPAASPPASAPEAAAPSAPAPSTPATTPPAAAAPAKPAPAEPAPERRQVALAHNPALIENTPHGLLPKTGEGGLTAWRAYAHPFAPTEQRPRIAIAITGLGLSGAATEAAIQDLPSEVTLAFTPYASRLTEWIPMARAAGHEVMLALPMEPISFPQSDPGPQTLLTSLSPVENLDRMEWALGRFTGYVGVVDLEGSRFTTSEQSLMPILQALKDRGLMYLDSKRASTSLAAQVAANIDLPYSVNSRFLDDEASRIAIDRALADLERLARSSGSAVGIGHPYPVTLERLRAWLPTLAAKGLVLAPITATVERRARG